MEKEQTPNYREILEIAGDTTSLARPLNKEEFEALKAGTESIADMVFLERITPKKSYKSGRQF